MTTTDKFERFETPLKSKLYLPMLKSMPAKTFENKLFNEYKA